MNFLAHAWLAGDAPMDRLGGVMGDFVKGPLPAGLPAEIAEGVRLHRKIDVYADSHPAFLRSCARVSRCRRRVAAIMVDMFYDHFLARHWAAFHGERLECFTASIYALLRRHHELLPARLQRILPYMAGDDWLASYRDVDSIVLALDRISTRLRRTDMLTGAGEELLESYAGFEADFLVFMPDAKRFAGRYRAARPANAAGEGDL